MRAAGVGDRPARAETKTTVPRINQPLVPRVLTDHPAGLRLRASLDWQCKGTTKLEQ
jgi:hypothetical protein